MIPVLHDAAVLEQLLDAQVSPDEQWVVVNGDAADHDMVLLRSRFPTVQWIDSPPGRGPQQNAGARLARGTWLLFLHADTRLPAGWRAEVTATHRAASNLWGCFRLGIDSDAWQARAIEWCVRARVALCALPYGDQGLLVRRDVFDRVGGFPPYPLMEDVALVRALGRLGKPRRMALQVRTSARRWERDGWWRRSIRNLVLLGRYLLGARPGTLVAAYEGWSRTEAGGRRRGRRTEERTEDGGEGGGRRQGKPKTVD